MILYKTAVSNNNHPKKDAWLQILENNAPADVFEDFRICIMFALETDAGTIVTSIVQLLPYASKDLHLLRNYTCWLFERLHHEVR